MSDRPAPQNNLDELLKRLFELKSELFKERSSVVTKGGSKNTKAIRTLRKNIARTLATLENSYHD
jgi:ribosomal protein L29